MNNRIKEELYYTIQLINSSKSDYIKFSKYCPLYSFTNENIRGMLKNVDFKDKDILLPCSSSDHIFNALLTNPKHITAYDINILTKHLFELKRAAIIELDRNEFMGYFHISKTIIPNNSLNKKTYNKIRVRLNEDERQYWDTLYSFFSPKELRKSKLFKPVYYSKKTIENINPYLDEDNYNKLKIILKDYKLDFINTNITNIPNILNTKYDYIYLSNIADYFYTKDVLFELKELVIRLKNILNINGSIGIVYLYNYLDDFYYDTKYALYNKEKRDKYFSSFEYDYIDFPSGVYQKKDRKVKVLSQDKDGILYFCSHNNDNY